MKPVHEVLVFIAYAQTSTLNRDTCRRMRSKTGLGYGLTGCSEFWLLGALTFLMCALGFLLFVTLLSFSEYCNTPSRTL